MSLELLNSGELPLSTRRSIKRELEPSIFEFQDQLKKA
jgi:hypothetical protein